MFLELTFIGYGAYRLVKSLLSPTTVGNNPTLTGPPERVISFVGATSTGKSSALNALLEQEVFCVAQSHGATRSVESAYAPFGQGYLLLDTPGLMDTSDYGDFIWDAIKRSQVVVFTVTDELYREELEMVERISTEQRRMNTEARTSTPRIMAVFVNKMDVKRTTLLSSEYVDHVAIIRSQVASWIPTDRVFFGAASPVADGLRLPPQIEGLKRFLRACVGDSCQSE